MKKASEVVFSLTRQQWALLKNPEAKANTLGPDSRFILEQRGLLRRAGNAWERTRDGDKVLRALEHLTNKAGQRI